MHDISIAYKVERMLRGCRINTEEYNRLISILNICLYESEEDKFKMEYILKEMKYRLKEMKYKVDKNIFNSIIEKEEFIKKEEMEV